MIQQVLNKQLLQDVLDSMQAQAQASVADQRRAVTGTPMDEMGPTERVELLHGIETAKKDASCCQLRLFGQRLGVIEELLHSIHSARALRCSGRLKH